MCQTDELSRNEHSVSLALALCGTRSLINDSMTQAILDLELTLTDN
jgi:hypothetical protein